jgi:hypothetical protein
MNDIIAEYQRWKQQGGDIRNKARQAMEARFRDILLEAVKLAEEYHADFGTSLKPPPVVTAFRFKSGKAKKAKPVAKTAAPAAKPEPAKPEPVKPAPAAKPDAKINALHKRLATARQKLEAAKAAGAPTRNLDDRIYELEDELRLATATD